MQKIVAAIAYSPVNTTHHPPRFPQGSFLLRLAAGFEAFYFALRFCQSLFVTPEKARVWDKLAVTGGGKVFQPHVNTNLFRAFG